MSPVRRPCSAALAVGGLTLVALLLRASQIGQSLFADELWAFDAISEPSLGGVVAGVRHGPELNPPLFFVLAWASARLGDPTVWLRLPSLVFGTALVPATYVLGRHAVGRLAGVLGAGIVALAPFAVQYSIEARPYALLAFLTVVSTICLLRALEADGKAWWAAYSIASAAAAYTHYTAVLVLAAQAGWAAWTRRERLAQLIAANLAALVLFAPWIPHVLDERKPAVLAYAYGELSVAPAALARTLVGILPGSPFTSLARLPGSVAAAAFAAGLALALAGALSGPHARPRTADGGAVTLTMLVVPAVLAGLLAISAAVGVNLFGPRNAITALPYLALAIGWLLARSPRGVAALAALLIGGSLGTGAVLTAGDAGQRPRYRDAAALIEASARPGDVVLERELFPSLGPLSAHLTLYLSPRVTYLREGRDDARAWAAARRGGRVLFVQVIAPTPRGRLPRTLGPDRLVLVERRLLPGFAPVSVATYRRGATRDR